MDTETAKQKFLLFLQGKGPELAPQERKLIRVGMTGGAFDVLHLGHVFTLQKAKENCDFLIVVVASDELVKKVKGKLMHSQEYRRKVVEAVKYVDFAMDGGEERLEPLNKVKPDIVIFGYDQKPFVPEGEYEIFQIKDFMDESIYKSSRIIRDLGY